MGSGWGAARAAAGSLLHVAVLLLAARGNSEDRARGAWARCWGWPGGMTDFYMYSCPFKLSPNPCRGNSARGPRIKRNMLREAHFYSHCMH